MKKAIIALLTATLALPALAAFPTNTVSKSVDSSTIDGSFDDFKLQVRGYETYKVTFGFRDGASAIDLTGYVGCVKVSKYEVSQQVDYISWNTTDNSANISISTSNIVVTIPNTNIPPNNSYEMELWVYDGATTNVSRTLGQGALKVTDSLYDDGTAFPWPSTGDLANYLPLAGGTMTGFLTLSAAPTATLHAATKGYVDDNESTHTNRNMALMTNWNGSVVDGNLNGQAYQATNWSDGSYTGVLATTDYVDASTTPLTPWTSDIDGAATNSLTNVLNGTFSGTVTAGGQIIGATSISATGKLFANNTAYSIGDGLIYGTDATGVGFLNNSLTGSANFYSFGGPVKIGVSVSGNATSSYCEVWDASGLNTTFTNGNLTASGLVWADHAMGEASKTSGDTLNIGAGGYTNVPAWHSSIADSGFAVGATNIVVTNAARYTVDFRLAGTTAAGATVTTGFYTNGVLAVDGGGQNITAASFQPGAEHYITTLRRTIDLPANVDCELRMQSSVNQLVSFTSASWSIQRN